MWNPNWKASDRRNKGLRLQDAKKNIRSKEMEEKLKGIIETQESLVVASMKEIGKGSNTFVYSSITL